jgi:hypothetical protein
VNLPSQESGIPGMVSLQHYRETVKALMPGVRAARADSGRYSGENFCNFVGFCNRMLGHRSLE